MARSPRKKKETAPVTPAEGTIKVSEPRAFDSLPTSPPSVVGANIIALQVNQVITVYGLTKKQVGTQATSARRAVKADTGEERKFHVREVDKADPTKGVDVYRTE